MNVYTNIDQIISDKNSILTIGTFDGIHIGHQNLLTLLKEKAISESCRNFLVTFEPHPRVVVSKKNGVKLLTTLDEKLAIFEKFGIENVLVLEFTEKLSQTEYPDFIENIVLKGIGAKHIVIGYDHKFGKNRSGDENKLRELGEKFDFGVTTVPPVEFSKVIVSSTKIRKALTEGDIDTADKYLGRPYTLSGYVVEGARRGRTLGFPTANVEVNDSRKLIPGAGVYAVAGRINDQPYMGMMNIGVRPTFEVDGQNQVEIHVFDFNRDIYGQVITIEFIHRIRDEIKFESKDELIHQIKIDKQLAHKVLKNLNN